MVVLEFDREGATLTVTITALGMTGRNKDLLFSSMKRTREWIYSQEVPTDVTILIGDASFSLHKFPLVSKCGYIKKLLVTKSNNADISTIIISDIPGGAEAFELAVKFCYGVNFEISTENIALLRCVAEYLEMTENYAAGNLVGRTESYLNDVYLKSLAVCVYVLVASEKLLPMAEQVKLIRRCIDSIAYLASKDWQFSKIDKVEDDGIESANSSLVPPQQTDLVHWLAEDLSMLRIEMFQRVIIAMIARGINQCSLGPILMIYAQKSLRVLESFGMGTKKIEPKEELEKRVVIETIVSLLPRQRNVLPVSFFTMLLRSAIYMETTVACRFDLERRIALQLAQANLDDLLIPAYSLTGETLFDVDTVRRIIMNYREYEVEGNCLGYGAGEELVSAPSNDFEKVGKLMENYFAEIASDRNLTVSKFIGLIEVLPEQSRVTEDGIYKAIDTFLKAHPNVSEMERKQVCSLMNCQKLSHEARAHAAQNDRLPVQVIVQVLYYEQQRLHETVNGTGDSITATNTPSSDEHLKLMRENEEMKLDMLKLKMKLKEVEKPAVVNCKSASSNSPVPSSISSADQKRPLPKKSFISSVSKKLGRLFMTGELLTPSKDRIKVISRNRRHSIS